MAVLLVVGSKGARRVDLASGRNSSVEECTWAYRSYVYTRGGILGNRFPR
jgi:hypothetical protein